jgi:uncharacterized protein YdeI (YjbR/CyaY-like superfamily)
MIPTDRFDKVEITNLDQLREWLSANHARSESVWLVRYKQSVPDKHVDRLSVLDELLCFGWVDGVARKLDAERTMQLISPRRQEAWAQSYKYRVARLEVEGRMAEPGRAAVARGMAGGLWDAYADSDRLLVPPDVAETLAREPLALRSFEEAAPSYRRNILRWIGAAKRPETRTKRIAEVFARSRRGEKVPQM